MHKDSAAKPLMLIIGCDCDPDRPRYGGGRYDVRRSPQQWKGIGDGLRSLQEILESLEPSVGLKPRVIFCVRADMQMKEIYGSAGWMVEEFLPLWRELAGQGHEIAWHPHLWRWSDERACWYQETRDAEWISACLHAGFSDFAKAWGERPFTCHMGWTFHNDISMQTISRLGVKMDFSASPGVFFEGGPGAAGTVFDNRIDWQGTPQRWYRPSAADYRRPRRGDEEELDIVEIPKFTSRAGLLKKAKELAYLARKGTRPARATSAFLQVTVLPLLFNRIIQERFDCEQAEPFFATYFHPDELLERRTTLSASFLYSKRHMEKNLRAVVEKGRREGLTPSFVTGPEAVDFVKTSA